MKKKNYIIVFVVLLVIVAMVLIIKINDSRLTAAHEGDSININETQDDGISLRARAIYRNGYAVEYISKDADAWDKEFGDGGFGAKPECPDDMELIEHLYFFVEQENGEKLLKREEFVYGSDSKEISLFFSDDRGEWLNEGLGISGHSESRIDGKLFYIFGDKDTGYYEAVNCSKSNGLYFNLAVRGFTEEELIDMIDELS